LCHRHHAAVFSTPFLFSTPYDAGVRFEPYSSRTFHSTIAFSTPMNCVTRNNHRRLFFAFEICTEMEFARTTCTLMVPAA